MTQSSQRTRQVLGGGSSIAVAMGVMNVATYGYTMIAANVLGPQQYGAFAALMNVLLVISVVSLGLQATAARRISADPDHVGQIEAAIMRVTYRASLGLGVLLLLLAPVVNHVLRLDSLTTAVVLAFAAVPVTVMGGQAGTLQGERRWAALAALYLAAGVPRLVLGTALILWQPTEAWALVGVAVGGCAPVLVGWWALRHQRAPGLVSEHHAGRQILRESLHNSQALLAFFALSNVDIIVARNVLDEHAAGLYAGGLILAKAMLFLPQFVVVVAFPSMATAGQARRALTRSLGVVAALGVVGTLAAWALADVAIVFVGGADYAEIKSQLWVFAVLGTLLSMLQLLVYSVLARQGQRSVYLVWAALAVLIGVGVTADDLSSLVAIVVAVDAALLLVLLGINVYLMRDERAEQVA
ncbi:lipopolysaccharide biosynthesis protein [Nocardioides sp. LHG3406-4]|uniref:lipopolysaccharide biosynthesis protein n=1 Tax=Nocardioides sp. LHG3406-4 TaxID=2804575 RepID=UPI003CF296EA